MSRQRSTGTLDREDIEWTPRQREVLDLLARGYTNPQIGEHLGLTLDGAKWHVSEVLSKLGVNSREEAAAYWREHNGPAARLRRSLSFIGAGLGFRVAGGAALAVAVAVVAVVYAGMGDSETTEGDDAPQPSETPAVRDSEVEGPTVVWETAVVDGDFWTSAIVVFDIGRQQTVSTLRFDSRQLLGSQLVGDTIYAFNADEVFRISLDGTERHALYQRRANELVTGVVVSSDGSTAAITVDGGLATEMWEVMFFDLHNEEVISRFPLAPEVPPGIRAVDFSLHTRLWRDDGNGVVLYFASPYGGYPLSVQPDGTVQSHSNVSQANIAPTGRWASNSEESIGCEGTGGHRSIELVDLDSGERLNHVRSIDPMTPFQWSLDGQYLLVYQRALVDPDGCEWTDEEPVYFLLPLDGSGVQRVNDVDALLDGWYGSRRVIGTCESRDGVVWPSSVRQQIRVSCPRSEQVDLRVGGRPAGTGYGDTYLLGFVESDSSVAPVTTVDPTPERADGRLSHLASQVDTTGWVTVEDSRIPVRGRMPPEYHYQVREWAPIEVDGTRVPIFELDISIDSPDSRTPMPEGSWPDELVMLSVVYLPGPLQPIPFGAPEAEIDDTAIITVLGHDVLVEEYEDDLGPRRVVATANIGTAEGTVHLMAMAHPASDAELIRILFGLLLTLELLP